MSRMFESVGLIKSHEFNQFSKFYEKYNRGPAVSSLVHSSLHRIWFSIIKLKCFEIQFHSMLETWVILF